MEPYRRGDRGEPVRDIQGRLVALGFGIVPDQPGSFGEGTDRAVRDFQRSRGLITDGLVGPETWRELVEAGYRLGDRLLDLRRPMLRGDDVAELQRRLNALGFEAGKVDGIFGPATARAVTEFQRNRGTAEDGIAGPEVIEELALVARATRKTGREAVREREWLRTLSPSIVGRKVFLDPGCRTADEAARAWDSALGAAAVLREHGAQPLMSRSQDTFLADRVRARRANRMGADVVVSFQYLANSAPAVSFFASALSRSEVGAQIASALAEALSLPTEGLATTILKETRAPAVVVAAPLSEDMGRACALALVRFFDEEIQSPEKRR